MSDAPPDSPIAENDAVGAPSRGTCPNCESRSVENFCANCGQQASSLHTPVRVFIAEAMKRIFALDSRIWQTLIILIRRPGLLTSHYLQGKRARYVAPLRLYFFASFFTFLLLTVIPESGPSFELNSSDSTAVDQTVQDDSTESDGPALEIEMDESPWWVEDYLRPAVENPSLIAGTFRRRLPWVFFFVMPVFASTLQILYRKRESYYVPHLIFTLHAYAAGFLMFGLGTGIDALVDFLNFSGIAVLATVVHLFLSLRRVYGEDRRRTMVKEICLLVIHSFFATVGVLLLLLYAILVM